MPTVNDTLNDLKDRLDAQRARGQRVWAGGSPRFDERQPGPPAQSRKPCAGGNPHFDERGAPRKAAPKPQQPR